MKRIYLAALLVALMASSPVLARGGPGGGHGQGGPNASSGEWEDHHDRQAWHGKQWKQEKRDAKGNERRREREHERQDGPNVSIRLSAGEARGFARDAGIPHGGYKPLPPGMRNRLAKGKPLPPGISKKALPPEMLTRLPERPGHEWVAVGVDLVLVNSKTRIAIDIFADIF